MRFKRRRSSSLRDLARNAHVLQRRHVDHVAAGQRDVRGDARALLSQRLLGDLNDNLLAFLQQIVMEGCRLRPLAALRLFRLVPLASARAFPSVATLFRASTAVAPVTRAGLSRCSPRSTSAPAPHAARNAMRIPPARARAPPPFRFPVRRQAATRLRLPRRALRLPLRRSQSIPRSTRPGLPRARRHDSGSSPEYRDPLPHRAWEPPPAPRTFRFGVLFFLHLVDLRAPLP